MTPAEALEKLKKGNRRFVSGEQKPRDYNAKVIATAAGQYPFAAIVSCMDSRAPMEIILDQGIGDMFSLRTAGNVVDEDVLGGLEYAAKVVGAKLLLVLGHTGCGAVKGAIDDVHLGNLTQLLAKIRPAIALASPGSFSSDKSFVKPGRRTECPSRHQADSRPQRRPPRPARCGRDPRGRGDLRHRDRQGRTSSRIRPVRRFRPAGRSRCTRRRWRGSRTQRPEFRSAAR